MDQFSRKDLLARLAPLLSLVQTNSRAKSIVGSAGLVALYLALRHIWTKRSPVRFITDLAEVGSQFGIHPNDEWDYIIIGGGQSRDVSTSPTSSLTLQ